MSTTTTPTDPTKTVSPKVIVGLLTGLAIAAIGGIVAAVTPDTFSFLGAWGPIIYSLVTIGGAQLAAFLKNDPLRTATAPVGDFATAGLVPSTEDERNAHADAEAAAARAQNPDVPPAS